MFKRSIVSVFILVIGFVSSQVNAALVSSDWITQGDSKATLDTATGLEWLDLTLTADHSYNSISQDSSLYPGWRFATITEVKGLFERYLAYYTQKLPANGFTSGYSHSRSEATIFRNLFGQTYDGKDYRTNGFVYDAGKDRVGLFGFVTATSQAYNIFTYDYSPGSYSVNTKSNLSGWFLVSDGGTTLSSINNPALNINNPNAPVNQVPEAPADVPVHAGFGLLGLLLMAFGLRRRKSA